MCVGAGKKDYDTRAKYNLTGTELFISYYKCTLSTVSISIYTVYLTIYLYHFLCKLSITIITRNITCF